MNLMYDIECKFHVYIAELIRPTHSVKSISLYLVYVLQTFRLLRRLNQ
jgi:hypothetical protein